MYCNLPVEWADDDSFTGSTDCTQYSIPADNLGRPGVFGQVSKEADET